jgi:hypothetical protein
LWSGRSVTLSILSAGERGVAKLMLEARAERGALGSGGAYDLVLVNASMQSTGARTLSAAFLNLLYKLDSACLKAECEKEP